MEELPKLITVNEAAKYLNVNPNKFIVGLTKDYWLEFVYFLQVASEATEESTL